MLSWKEKGAVTRNTERGDGISICLERQCLWCTGARLGGERPGRAFREWKDRTKVRPKKSPKG